MIDNFATISYILREKTITEDNFFFLQIIKRRKENPDMTSNNITVDVFYIKDPDHLMEKKERIVARCKAENARAYLNLNMNSKRKVALETMKLMATCISNDNYNVANVYTSVVGGGSQDPNKTWVVDIDFDANIQLEDQLENIEVIKDDIRKLAREAGKEPIINVIPTKNGLHLITPTFNLKKFSDMHRGIDIHKNNPTILYIP